MQSSQEHLETITTTNLGGQTEYIKGDSRKENRRFLLVKMFQQELEIVCQSCINDFFLHMRAFCRKSKILSNKNIHESLSIPL